MQRTRDEQTRSRLMPPSAAKFPEWKLRLDRFSEDEMRRPTPCAVPLGSAKVDGLLKAHYGRRIGPPWMLAKSDRR
jgi:hypothetical protein